MIDPIVLQKDFPIFSYDKQMIYLDSAATSLKPACVISKLTEYYSQYSANIHRGIYKISEKATEEYEMTRKETADFIGAQSQEIIFTRNTTESINLIAYTLGEKIVHANDNIVASYMEHHSNFVPWQQLAKRKNALFTMIPCTLDGKIHRDLEKYVTKRTKFLCLTLASNVLGTINPLPSIIEHAKRINPKIITVVDAAQAVPHIHTDVKKLRCDFFAFSAHKMLGPTNVGILWGKAKHLSAMPPFLFGGGMIKQVTKNRTIFADVPSRFEAGTPGIAEVIAFKEAVRYIKKIGIGAISSHEKNLCQYLIASLIENFGKRCVLLGGSKPRNRVGVVSLNIKDIHPHDIAAILDERKHICVRAGHHCTLPLHSSLGFDSSLRISMYMYNSRDDIDNLISALHTAISILS